MNNLQEVNFHIDDNHYYHHNDLANGFYKTKDNIHCFKDGLIHRSDGPAMIYCPSVNTFSSFIAWYENGLRHRLDGPAVQYISCEHFWYINNIRYQGWYQWWYKGKLIGCSNQEEFERIIKLVAFF